MQSINILTKHVGAHPIPSKEANTIAENLVNQFILKYGLFKTLKADSRTELRTI